MLRVYIFELSFFKERERSGGTSGCFSIVYFKAGNNRMEEGLEKFIILLIHFRVVSLGEFNK